MTFRDRLTLSLAALAVLPLLVLGYGVRREMRSRLDADAARRVDAVATALNARLTSVIDTERERLASLAADLAGDNRFRTAIADANSSERGWLLGWASASMRPAGLAVLQLQDSSGRILSSGHFRNDFDRIAPELPRVIAASPAHAAVADVRTPSGHVRALATSVTFTARGAPFTLVGGLALDSAYVAGLATDAAVCVVLEVDAPQAGEGDALAAATLPYVDEPKTASAHFLLIHDSRTTEALKAGVTRWLLITLGGTLVVAVIIASALGRLMSAPIVDLADRTGRLDLDRLDQRFSTGRDDEIGALARTLDALVGRLRASVSRLREAERSAATGDLARQVNHDIKNGLAPIRNVLRHLAQVAEREPATLASVFTERRATLESSVEYLDALARNYARLSPALRRAPTDLRPIVLGIASGVTAVTVETRVPERLPRVLADAVVLHRILDNLVSNAVDALDGNPGTVTVEAEAIDESTGKPAAANGSERRVRITVSDTGRGMTREELRRAFDDFHTTKPTGTGLGLSVVRRLLTDLGGSMRVETAPGEGTTFTVELPAIDEGVRA
ncbi:MAG TPA: HAMP domain-containing sensor histidine kinase [Gemmatimonadaceae bacterium]|nr:HAMP domain-containing sensor histidine kinase [Gemmatimonadaceae bacterium]